MVNRQLLVTLLGSVLVHMGCGAPAATPVAPGQVPVISETSQQPAIGDPAGGDPATSEDPATSAGESARDQSSPKAAAESFLANLRDGYKDGALALGTQEWQSEEMASGGGFLNAIFDEGVVVKQWQMRGVEMEGESAKVSVKALLVSPDGGIDNEPMRFDLLLIEGKWWISGLN